MVNKQIIGIFLFAILLSSLVIVVEAKRLRNANNADNPTDVNLNDLIWKDAEHKKFHEASEILVNWSGETRNLQDLIDNNLISFPYFDGTLMMLDIPAGDQDSYNKYCTYENKPVRRVLNNYGLSRDAQYVELKEKFDTPTSLVYGGVYDFSCSYGENEISSKKKVVLTENFTVVGTFKEPHINRIIRVANNYEYSNSDDTFSYMVAMQEGKLVVRVARPENCRNINRDILNVPICTGVLDAFKNINTNINDKNEFELLQASVSGSGYCTSGSTCNGLPTSEVGGCTGLYCGCRLGRPGCYASITQIPGFNSNSETTSGNFGSNIQCFGSISVDLPETFCRIKQCPIYDAKKGLLQKQTIYAWKNLNCKIKPGI